MFVSGDVPRAVFDADGNFQGTKTARVVVLSAPASAGATLKLATDFEGADGVVVRVAFGSDGEFHVVHDPGYNVKSWKQSDGHVGSPTIPVPAGTTRVALMRQPGSAASNDAPVGFSVSY